MIYPNYCNLDKEKRRHGGQFWEKIMQQILNIHHHHEHSCFMIYVYIHIYIECQNIII